MSNSDDPNYFPYPTGNLEQIFRGADTIMDLDAPHIQHPQTLIPDVYHLSNDNSNPAWLWYARNLKYDNVTYWVTYTKGTPQVIPEDKTMMTSPPSRLVTLEERNNQQDWQAYQHKNAGSTQWPVIEDRIIASGKVLPEYDENFATWAEEIRKRLFPDRGGLYDPVRETFEGHTREIPREKLYDPMHRTLGQSSAQAVPRVPATPIAQEKGKGVDRTATYYPPFEQDAGSDNGGVTYIGKGKGVDRSGVNNEDRGIRYINKGKGVDRSGGSSTW
ncbi:hypothetical protein EYC80_003536 [Monilinia laxa]|uniref:Uncharacterized protein n=1 Tax=Monilinia laxa TaxID=61186 RepID=A0A5N6KJZ2_MONLA|nr:hypothetical protein EYC80_003536 [Monilinia laxa]